MALGDNVRHKLASVEPSRSSLVSDGIAGENSHRLNEAYDEWSRRGSVAGPTIAGRVVADGKYLRAGAQPFRVRGLTYGSFVARGDGFRYPDAAQVRSDFAQIARMGMNTVRLYTAPPNDVVEAAAELSLRLVVGVDYEDWRYQTLTGRRAHRLVRDAGRRALDEAFATCSGRHEVLAYSVGNEVPADVVRVHGIGAVQDVLADLMAHVRVSDPGVLVTYTNFPSTEYLEIEGQSLATFNVFLEDRLALRRYLRHLQVVTSSVPLVISELGLAGDVHGARAQADSLRWQLDEVDEAGCAGATIFAFTDEWGVDGVPLTGWGFGITDPDRMPKPAVTVSSAWATRSTAELRNSWPTVSAVVCAYNEERTIGQCLASLAACTYPNLDVVVCDDGSTDRTLQIARTFPFRILELEHGGLSRARNAAIAAATGEIVSFLDADAACDPDWPWRLAMCFDDEAVVASGGPNLPFPDAGFVERAVALSPGAPTEVLVTDDRAEHVPGCNMAFRREAILAVGCFDPIYTSAGDDVDVCWKLLDAEGEIAFSPAAQIYHHRRGTVKGYLRQQHGYGRAEKLLQPAHRHRFNNLGQARWAGFVYGGARLLPSVLRPVVYHGYQGHAPFQTVTSRPSETALGWAQALLPVAVPMLMTGVVGGLLLSTWWLLAAAAAAVLVLAYGAAVAISLRTPADEPRPVRLRLLVGLLHILQPCVRTWGRLSGPRRPHLKPIARPWWGDRSAWLRDLERNLRWRGFNVGIGGPTDDWDLEVRHLLHSVRVTAAVVWKWQPQSRIQVAAGRLALALGLATVAAVLLELSGVGAWVLVAPLLLALFGSVAILRSRRTVTHVVSGTVPGARVTGTE